MKRFLHFVCLLAIAALMPAALLISRGLPADTHVYVEKKYAGWSGVLRAWICVEWSGSENFSRWLNDRAAEFEKSHDGVYIEFTPVSAEALRGIGENGIRPPELVLFSPGALKDSSKLAPIGAANSLRSELRDFGGNIAWPVAMGGYAWVYNRQLASGAPGAGDIAALPPDDGARSFSAAAVALFCDTSEEEAADEKELPESGVDLGLPASANAGNSGLIVAEDALNRFLNGELPAVAVTQVELTRLIRLRDAGRGPDWTCAAAGQVCYTDQLLLFSLTSQTDDGAAARFDLAKAFGESLLEPDAQKRLADIGAFSVTGERIYDGLSAYAALDAQLNGRELLTPADPWSEPPDCGDLLLRLETGAATPEQALAQLRAQLRERQIYK